MEFTRTSREPNKNELNAYSQLQNSVGNYEIQTSQEFTNQASYERAHDSIQKTERDKKDEDELKKSNVQDTGR